MNCRKLFFSISAIIFLSLLLKLYYARICSLYIWGDTGVIGLIAKQILKGEFPLFFYGHFYMGVLESWIIAPFFLLFGISSYTIHLGPVFISCLFLISVYFLGKELKDYRIGLIALIYCAVPPFYLLKQGVIPLGYHIEMLFLGNIIFLLTLKIVDSTGYRKVLIYFCLLGIVSGLSFWNTYLILYYLISAVIFLSLNMLLKKRYSYLVIGGIVGIFFFFVGGIHFWIFNLTHNFASFKFLPMRNPGFLILFKRITTYHLPRIMGFENNVLSIASVLLYLVSGIFFIFLKNYKKWLFIIFIIGMVYFLTRSEYYAFCMDHRYVLPIFSVIPFIVAVFIDWVSKKTKILGISILFFLIIVNCFQILKGFTLDKEEFSRDGAIYNELLNFLRKHGITGVYGKFSEVGTINFLGQDKIYAAEVFNSSFPFDIEVQSANRVAYLSNLRPFFDLGCSSYKVENIEGYNICYDFKPLAYDCKEIIPDNWKAVSNYGAEFADWGFDRNLDRYWSSLSPMKTGMYYEIEFPKIYTICKFQIFNLPGDSTHFPIGYKILVSEDGMKWDLIQEAGAVQPMFWSGLNIIWHMRDTRLEVVFKPARARFIRIEQIGESKYPWEINEIIFYEYTGVKGFKARNYVNPAPARRGWVKSAKDIYNFLEKKGITFVYADYWLSAKFYVLSKKRLGVLGIFNECWPDRENMSRMIELDKYRAIVIEKQNEEGADKILTEFELPYMKRHFGEYTLYYFSPETEKDDYFLKNQSSLYWIGTTISRINLRGFGKLLFDYSKDFCLRAAGYFPGNPVLRCKLMQIYNEKGLKDLYEREKQFIRHRFSPKIKKYAKFSNNIEFLGLDIENLTDKKYRINYYWRLKENPLAKIFVFAHFIKDGNVVLQNDHPLLEQYVRLPILLPDEIWKESYILEFPERIDPDLCEKRIGLWIPVRGNERIKIAGSKKEYIKIDEK